MKVNYFLLTLYVFASFLITGAGYANEDKQKENSKHSMIHFGNMGGLLPTLNPEDFKEPSSQGAILTQKFCGQCHNAPGPGFRTAEEWKVTFWRMYWRMYVSNSQFDNIEAAKYGEGETIFKYLMRNAMQEVAFSSIPDDLEGAKDYKKICFQCHHLPNPKLHTKEDWPVVIKRMKRHMASMGRITPSAEEEKRILALLQNLSEK